MISVILFVFCWSIEPATAEYFIYPTSDYPGRSVTAVGDLPTDHHPYLVLRKGRTVPAILRFDFNSEITSEDWKTFGVEADVLDDSGRIVLMPSAGILFCAYNISEEQNITKMNITVMHMMLNLLRRNIVMFSDPPRFITGSEWYRTINKILISPDESKAETEEFLQLRKQLFLYPVMSAELILNAESEDLTSQSGKVIFGENASGDRTVFIEAGYKIDLQVKKDILFSADSNDHAILDYHERLKDEVKKEHSIFTSGDSIFVSDITDDNKHEHIMYSASARFRFLPLEQVLIGGSYKIYMLEEMKTRIISQNKNIDHSGIRVDFTTSSVRLLWDKLYDELSDAADPERFKIPYAYAFNLTKEEHALCEALPDEILNIIQGKEAILTWVSQEIQWSDKLRIRYLQDYIRILKENGHVAWAKTIENIERKNYQYDEKYNK